MKPAEIKLQIDELLEDETIDRPFAEEGHCLTCKVPFRPNQQVVHAGGLFADDYFCTFSCLRFAVRDHYVNID